MASNYNQRSSSSGSRRAGNPEPSRRISSRTTSSRSVRPSANIPESRASQRTSRSFGQSSAVPSRSRSFESSVRVGDTRAYREQHSGGGGKGNGPKRVIKLIVIIAFFLIVLAGGALAALYYTGVLSVEEVKVTGTDHLTEADVDALAAVPEGTTLLSVDTEMLRQRLLLDAWVQDAHAKRVFPHTIEIEVTERTISAVVEISSNDATVIRPWAISSDGVWLMPIPEKDSEAGKLVNAKIFEDADKALHIVDVPFGATPEIGTICTDSNVNNALAIVAGMTTELAGQVKVVRATDSESATLTLDNGIEVAFGRADEIRAKERVVLELMESFPGTLAYINVRVPDRPTWRSL